MIISKILASIYIWIYTLIINSIRTIYAAIWSIIYITITCFTHIVFIWANACCLYWAINTSIFSIVKLKCLTTRYLRILTRSCLNVSCWTINTRITLRIILEWAAFTQVVINAIKILELWTIYAGLASRIVAISTTSSKWAICTNRVCSYSTVNTAICRLIVHKILATSNFRIRTHIVAGYWAIYASTVSIISVISTSS